MDTTECLGIPYPQCEPPLIKDASDIIQFKALADVVDTAVDALADQLDEQLLTVDAVNVTGTVVTNDGFVTHFFQNTPSFDNGGLYDANKDLVVIKKDGWYAVGGWVSASSAILPASHNMRINPVVNGLTVSARQGPGQPAVGFEYIAWTDVLFMRAGDELQVQTITSLFATTVTYEVTLWAVLVIANV